MSKKEPLTLYVYVGTAGIGRMGFGSWLGDEKINRSDGDDAGTYGSIVDALEMAGKRLEDKFRRHFYAGEKFEPIPLLKGAAAKKHRDVLAVQVMCIDTYDGLRFEAKWMGVDGDGYCEPDEDEREPAGEGGTIVEALRDLGENTQNELAHTAWVMRFT